MILIECRCKLAWMKTNSLSTLHQMFHQILIYSTLHPPAILKHVYRTSSREPRPGDKANNWSCTCVKILITKKINDNSEFKLTVLDALIRTLRKLLKVPVFISLTVLRSIGAINRMITLLSQMALTLEWRCNIIIRTSFHNIIRSLILQ